MYSKTNMFAANTLAILLLLVAAAATIVSATHPKFRKRDAERSAEQLGASPVKVITTFCLLNTGTKKVAIALSKLSF